jgi:hypothetical protein
MSKLATSDFTDEWISARSGAILLGVTLNQLNKLVYQGKIPVRLDPGTTPKFNRTAILSLIEERKRSAEE